MKENFLNIVLKSDFKDLKKNADKLIITKGNVSGYSIEIEDTTTQSQSSYIYYERDGDRDKDFELLLKTINEIENEQ
jgi:hypothetical protein